MAAFGMLGRMEVGLVEVDHGEVLGSGRTIRPDRL